MQLLWVVPSVGYGIFLLVTTGQWFGLVFGGLSLFSTVVSLVSKDRRPAVSKDQPVHFGPGRIAIGNRILPRWEALWKAEWAEQVYAALVAKNHRTQARLRVSAKLAGSLSADHRPPGQLCLWLGFAGTDSVEVNLSEDGGHGILVGPTGSGKSQLLTSMLVSACQGYSPAALRLALVDFKGGSALCGFAGTGWNYGFETDLSESAQELVARIRRELRDRQVLLAAHQAARIQDLPELSRPPVLLLVIDELQAVLQISEIQNSLEDIAARGRSLGVHLLATTQSLQGISRSLLVNLGFRIAIGKPDPIDLAQLGISRQPEQPLGDPKLDTAWIMARYSSPNEIGSFLFPAGGAVSQNLTKYLFSTESKTKDYSNEVFDTDFVEKPLKNFDFSFGF